MKQNTGHADRIFRWCTILFGILFAFISVALPSIEYSYATTARSYIAQPQRISLFLRLPGEILGAHPIAPLAYAVIFGIIAGVICSIALSLYMRARRRLRWSACLLLFTPAIFLVIVIADVGVTQALRSKARQSMRAEQERFSYPSPEDGMIIGVSQVEDVLSVESEVPRIIDASDDFAKDLMYARFSLDNFEKKTFYEAYILRDIIDKSSMELQKWQDALPFDIVYIPSDYILAVQRVSFDMVSRVVPILAYHVVARGLPDVVSVKGSDYSIAVALPEDYLKIRTDQEKEQGDRLLAGIAKAKKAVSDLQNNIITNEEAVRSNDESKASSASRLSRWYDSCRRVKGEDDQYCTDERSRWEGELSKYDQANTEIQEYVNQTRLSLSRYQEVLGSWQKAYEDFRKNPRTPVYEEGVFHPPDGIIMEYSGDQKKLLHYLTIAVHELLHYYSYQKDATLPDVYNEAMTDFFAHTYLGQFSGSAPLSYAYDEEVLVLMEILKRVSMHEMRAVYISQKEEQWEGLIDSAYGPGMYKKLTGKMEMLLQFVPTDREGRESIKNEIVAMLSG
ncbi:hypothetical protein KKB64_00385 [Patescibacteria group bacterium]|nr:hypothetical protein [Patescibacteria group bacterium]MBU1472231.1 hypothetical protein [Patescibacteria group bacterium]MBU2460517.1 hypothetical protein [Patescibacteria group bacterium]